MGSGVVDPRRTGYGIISPGAHPERGESRRKPTRADTGGARSGAGMVGGAPIQDVTGSRPFPVKGGDLGPIKKEIGRVQSINRAARNLTKRLGK